MEVMTAEDFREWLRLHRGERGREPYYENEPIVNPNTGQVTGSSRTRVGDKITAVDGATIILSRNKEVEGMPGPSQPEYVVVAKMDPEPDKAADRRTAEQTRLDVANAAEQERQNAEAQRLQQERDWNQSSGDPRASGLPETHMERALREAKEADAKRAQDATRAQIEASQASTAAAQARITQDQNELGYRRENDAANRALQQQQNDIAARRESREANKPDFLSEADTKNRQIAYYNPQTGAIEYAENSNYDAVKAAAEERRAEIATQIAQRQMTLDEGKQAYTQWFDTNVKTPLMLAQEARAKAEERRQALEAEERRRQFAADYRLRKATLGETAANRATQAEISLLPYRSGPTWGADISSAINSLAAGGKIGGPDASAGIHFSDSSFAFQKPDFKAIAKEATKAVLSGLTDYRPSDQQFETADYSGVPAVNLSGMPAMPSYSYGGAALPAPSPDVALPPE